ncbi:MAG: SDR family NAD(P)-dependent oxidoreductase, partial [Bacteroidaceae bacterium]|nr:SDR family NAD(P)-dependent oxidoreductase [Bacteroidaceae bacterium]
MAKRILVTGGAGFIGSHTLIELHKAGYEFVVVDNLVNSNPEALRRVGELIGAEVPFVKADIRDREALNKVFEQYKFDSCIHFAGLKAVGESVAKPLEYYENNMSGTFTLIDVMRQHGCKNIMAKRILGTGGAGLIGSHTLSELHKAGYEFVGVDNLVNYNPQAL